MVKGKFMKLFKRPTETKRHFGERSKWSGTLNNIRLLLLETKSVRWHDIEDVVNVWRDHFENISLPKYFDSSDAAHFEHVTNTVNEWCREDEEDEFLHQQISIDEVRNGLKIPQKGKGCDQANYFYP